MKFPQTHARPVILWLSLITLIGFCFALWDSPLEAGEIHLAALYPQYSLSDATTDVIRNPRTRMVRVRVTGPDDREAAAKLGPIVADDSSFVTVAATSLPASMPDGHTPLETTINLPSSSFDPLTASHAGTVAAGASPTEPGNGYYLVQFGVTATDELLDSLRDAGVTIVQYVPHQAFVVHGDGAAIGRAAAHSRVRWVGKYLPEYKPSRILREQLANARTSGRLQKDISKIETVRRNNAVFDVAVFSNADLAASGRAVVLATGGRLQSLIPLPNNFFNVVRIEARLDRIEEAAKVEEVFSIESWSRPTKEDEVAAQIVAGNYVGNVVAPGYDPFTQFGVSGQGVTVAVADDGIGIPGDGGFYITSMNAVDGNLRGATSGASGHGHLQASIIAGDTPFSVLDADGFNYGIGIAPKANLVNLPILRPGYGGTEANAVHDAVTTPGPNGILGSISNNSWGSLLNSNQYDSYAAQYDGFVRDASTGGGIDPLLIVFSAGNRGNLGLTRPKVAKNVIAVAATENVRPTLANSGGSTGIADDLEQLPDFSSRGPAADGRVKPDIAAPGDAVTGGRSGSDALFGNIGDYHRVSSGTSHAAPQVAGAAALFTEFWKSNNGGLNPSPAMIKAALINGAVDMTGAGAVGSRPNGSEGWGRLNLKNVLNTGAAMSHIDQSVALNSVGEIRNFVGTVPDSSRPVRISLVWTDAPGAVDPALVNDLDLEVLIGGYKYRGNVLAGGLSATGGSGDGLNNVENVFLPAGISGPITIRVVAKALNGDGILSNADSTDQHFALVVYNGTVAFSSAASPEGGQPAVLLGNNAFDPNECNLVNVPVTNLGGAAMTNVTAALSTTTPGVTVTVANANYPNIAAGATANGLSPFQVSTTNAVGCATNIDLVLTVSYSGMSGPSVFNYSLRVGTPPSVNYAFTSSSGATISPSGTLVPGSSADNAVVDFTSPFAFSIYDELVPAGATIRLSTNGHIRIESAGSAFAGPINTALPSTGGSGNPFPASLPVLMPYWDDLDLRTSTTTGGGIFTEVTGSPGSQLLKIEWRARNFLAGQPTAAPNVQFAVYFHENSSNFEYVYALTGGGIWASGASATVGVQGTTAGSTFTQFSFDSPSLSPGMMLTAVRPGASCTPGFGPCISTAADATISGRIVTTYGRAIRGAIVEAVDRGGTIHREISNSFGYFRMENIPVGQTIILNVSARGYSFAPTALNLSSDVAGLVITPQR